MIGSISMQGGGWGQVDLAALRQQRAAKMFKEMDADGNGSVSKDEFVSWDKKMRERMPQAGGADSMPSADDIFSALDSDGDGSLARTELSSIGETVRTLRQAQMFKNADADGNGSVSQDELAGWLDKMPAPGSGAGQKPSTEDVFAKLDADADGGLSQAEFSEIGRLGGPRGGRPHGPPPGGAAPAGAAEGAEAGGLAGALSEELEDSASSGEAGLDANGDGKITMREFVAWIKSYAATQGQGAGGDAGGSLDMVA